jgi:HEAT repeat protein
VPKAPSLEDRLAALSELRKDPDSPQSRQELRKCLASKTSLLAAKAARIAGECKVDGLAAELVEALDRFIVNPAATDRRCEAKLAVLKALDALEFPGHEPFLTGIRFVQMEASFGPPVDTAVELRAVSAIGLVRTNYPEIGVELVQLLADPQREARIGAIRAIAYWGTQAGALLLRYKILIGDRETEVTGQAFSALLYMEPARALDFVAGYLKNEDDALAEGAALAIGESRTAQAFDVLKAHAHSRIRPAVLLGIALLRQDEAITYLKDLLPDKHAKAALEIYQRG